MFYVNYVNFNGYNQYKITVNAVQSRITVTVIKILQKIYIITCNFNNKRHEIFPLHPSTIIIRSSTWVDLRQLSTPLPKLLKSFYDSGSILAQVIMWNYKELYNSPNLVCGFEMVDNTQT